MRDLAVAICEDNEPRAIVIEKDDIWSKISHLGNESDLDKQNALTAGPVVEDRDTTMWADTPLSEYSIANMEDVKRKKPMVLLKIIKRLDMRYQMRRNRWNEVIRILNMESNEYSIQCILPSCEHEAQNLKFLIDRLTKYKQAVMNYGFEQIKIKDMEETDECLRLRVASGASFV